jgi:hypothetical protein
MITVEDLLFFLDEALDGMLRVVVELGDDLATRRPAIDPVNSPCVTLSHCLGVMDYWGGQVIAGRESHRDRDAEFRTVGSVSDLVTRTRAARQQLALDLAQIEPGAAPRGALTDESDALLPLGSSQGGALMHLYSELAIHRGHMEICRDILMSSKVPTLAGAATPQPDSRYRID